MRQTYNWKYLAKPHADGYFTLETEETKGIPIRMFLTQQPVGTPVLVASGLCMYKGLFGLSTRRPV